MPAEAIHISALADTLALAPARLHRAMGAGVRDLRDMQGARAGVMLVDLPYFEGIVTTLARRAVGLSPRSSPWGDALHQRAPIALCRRLGEAGALLARTAKTGADGAYLIALALGALSHAAVDTALHPLVNRLSVRRAAAHGDLCLLRHHQEIEKLQSILFHVERHGRDYLGTAELRDHLRIDWRGIIRAGPAAAALRAILGERLGLAPTPAQLARWATGYRRFIAVLASPLGRLAASPAQRAEERGWLYEEVDFPARFAEAVARSARWCERLCDYLQDGRFDEGARAALSREVPEQSLDPPAEPDGAAATRV